VSVQLDGGVVGKIVAGLAALLSCCPVGRYSPEGTTVISNSSAVMVCRHQINTNGREDARVAMTDEAGFFPETTYRELIDDEESDSHRDRRGPLLLHFADHNNAVGLLNPLEAGVAKPVPFRVGDFRKDSDDRAVHRFYFCVIPFPGVLSDVRGARIVLSNELDQARRRAKLKIVSVYFVSE
jgi:hypothetical protein